jgi:hypothetical protein
MTNRNQSKLFEGLTYDVMVSSKPRTIDKVIGPLNMCRFESDTLKMGKVSRSPDADQVSDSSLNDAAGVQCGVIQIHS